MKKFIRKKLSKIFPFFGINVNLTNDLLIYSQDEKNKENHSNPLVKYGMKCFSQRDEDGITNEIIKRLKIENGYFIEFGVGDGTENNTLFLLSIGWSGQWYGGETLAFSTESSQKLNFEKIWITRDNISDLCKKVSNKKIDLISLDLDGNDYHLVKVILENGICPSIFIVEYNARFIPPTKFIMDYNEHHKWSGSDYYGASLFSFNKLFNQFNYTLVCCNSASGVNAFFVKQEFSDLFPEVPSDLSKIFSPPFYFTPIKYAHPISIKTIEQIINNKS